METNVVVPPALHPATGGTIPSGLTGGEQEAERPRYEFLCEKCKKPFELTMAISEREKAKPACPKCKGTKVIPQLVGFMGQTVKKS